jgi:hypothetical protein
MRALQFFLAVVAPQRRRKRVDRSGQFSFMIVRGDGARVIRFNLVRPTPVDMVALAVMVALASVLLGDWADMLRRYRDVASLHQEIAEQAQTIDSFNTRVADLRKEIAGWRPRGAPRSSSTAAWTFTRSGARRSTRRRTARFCSPARTTTTGTRSSSTTGRRCSRSTAISPDSTYGPASASSAVASLAGLAIPAGRRGPISTTRSASAVRR